MTGQVPLVDVTPASARMPAATWAIVSYLDPVQLGVALSVLHPADPYLAAVRAAVDAADLRHYGAVLQAEISKDVAAEYMARGMAKDKVRAVLSPRVPSRCDRCHGALPERRRAA